MCLVVFNLCLCCSFQADIMDVNQIFKDLAVMIHDQGEMIGKWENTHLSLILNIMSFNHFLVLCFTDSIEANVESAEAHVDRGAAQLQKAAYFQVS